MKVETYAVRRFALLLVLCVMLLSEFGCSTGRSGAPAHTTEGLEVRAYEVFGMGCPGCHGGLEKLLNEIPAVETSEANWKEKHVVVTLKPGAELEDEVIFDLIRRANFTPGERLR